MKLAIYILLIKITNSLINEENFCNEFYNPNGNFINTLEAIQSKLMQQSDTGICPLFRKNSINVFVRKFNNLSNRDNCISFIMNLNHALSNISSAINKFHFYMNTIDCREEYYYSLLATCEDCERAYNLLICVMMDKWSTILDSRNNCIDDCFSTIQKCPSNMLSSIEFKCPESSDELQCFL